MHRKIAVCYPGDAGSVFMCAVESLVNIRSPEGCEVRWFRGFGWCQARRRIHAAEQALEWGADVISCLDLDQVYEPDILERLLERHDSGCDIVAAMVPGRGYVEAGGIPPFGRLGWKIEEGAFTPVDPDAGDLQEADFPTSAAILFSARDIERLARPWYFFTYKPDTWEQVHGEDGTFALRMQRELGLTAWVDTTIRVKHAHVFAIDETFSKRFEDWAEPGHGEDGICRYDTEKKTARALPTRVPTQE